MATTETDSSTVIFSLLSYLRGEAGGSPPMNGIGVGLGGSSVVVGFRTE